MLFKTDYFRQPERLFAAVSVHTPQGWSIPARYTVLKQLVERFSLGYPYQKNRMRFIINKYNSVIIYKIRIIINISKKYFRQPEKIVLLLGQKCFPKRIQAA
ncbi:MAG: hypothetical protein IJV35_10795 [Neisseriaceae bacterium]|nr:hypothetical protein [Neisseriaceae bacterium]